MNVTQKPKTKLKIGNKIAVAVVALSAIATAAAVIIILSEGEQETFTSVNQNISTSAPFTYTGSNTFPSTHIATCATGETLVDCAVDIDTSAGAHDWTNVTAYDVPGSSPTNHLGGYRGNTNSNQNSCAFAFTNDYGLGSQVTVNAFCKTSSGSINSVNKNILTSTPFTYTGSNTFPSTHIATCATGETLVDCAVDIDTSASAHDWTNVTAYDVPGSSPANHIGGYRGNTSSNQNSCALAFTNDYGLGSQVTVNAFCKTSAGSINKVNKNISTSTPFTYTGSNTFPSTHIATCATEEILVDCAIDIDTSASAHDWTNVTAYDVPGSSPANHIGGYRGNTSGNQNSCALAFTNDYGLGSQVTVNAFCISGATVPSVVATPTASPAAGTYATAQSVTLATATAGAAIYYTTDGSTPTSTSTLYTAPIAISVTTTLKAIAVKSGMTNSGVLTALYTISTTPTYSCTGTTPVNAALCSGDDASLTANTAKTLVAVCGTPKCEYTCNSGYTLTSGVCVASVILQVATPTASPSAGTYDDEKNVTLSTATSGANIYYTTNGSTPTSASSIFSSSIKVKAGKTTTIKAIAIKAGMTDSSVMTAEYKIKDSIKSSKYYKKYKYYRDRYKNKISKADYLKVKEIRRNNMKQYVELKNIFLIYKGLSKNELKALNTATLEKFYLYKNFNGYKNYLYYKKKVGA